MHYTLNFKNDDLDLPKDFISYLENLPLFKYLESEFSTSQYEQAILKFTKFCQIIHLGTGGSSLGPQALYAILNEPLKLFRFFDNIDPDSFSAGLKNVDLSQTGVLIASKSGNTAETLVQLATLKKRFDELSLNLSDHLVIITQTDNNALHTFSKKHNILTVPHHDKIGGRFAVFAEVGELPGILMGLDMAQFRRGVQHAVADFKASYQNHAISQSAAFLAASKLNPVVFPYRDKLKKFGAWFAQLWAESLGKKNDRSERFGSTPLQAIGATDQHSQLQLYIDGPKDKFFTFLHVTDGPDLEVADLQIDHPSYNPLRPHGLKKLLDAELRATYQTLLAHDMPLRLISIPAVSPYSIGELMILSVLETLLTAKIWGIDPFDQPAVEEGKILALQFLNDKKESRGG